MLTIKFGILVVLVGQLSRQAWEFGRSLSRRSDRPCLKSGDCGVLVQDVELIDLLEDGNRAFGRGVKHQHVALSANGELGRMEVWIQSFPPAVVAPIHSQACQKIYCILQGQGSISYVHKRAVVSKRFAINDTIIVDRGLVHQVRNTGERALVVLVAVGCTPASMLLYPAFMLPTWKAQRVSTAHLTGASPTEEGRWWKRFSSSAGTGEQSAEL
eukprot:jgi/Botrbrau1/11751/Bobra.0195s0076.1